MPKNLHSRSQKILEFLNFSWNLLKTFLSTRRNELWGYQLLSKLKYSVFRGCMRVPQSAYLFHNFFSHFIFEPFWHTADANFCSAAELLVTFRRTVCKRKIIPSVLRFFLRNLPSQIEQVQAFLRNPNCFSGHVFYSLDGSTIFSPKCESLTLNVSIFFQTFAKKKLTKVLFGTRGMQIWQPCHFTKMFLSTSSFRFWFCWLLKLIITRFKSFVSVSVDKLSPEKDFSKDNQCFTLRPNPDWSRLSEMQF